MIDLPPADQLKLPLPDDLTLGELFAIRAATGVDVQEPESAVEQIAALTWFALQPDGPSWSQMLQLKPRDLEPYWADLQKRSRDRKLAEAAETAAAAQAREDAAALAEQAEALGEPATEPTPPTVDPT